MLGACQFPCAMAATATPWCSMIGPTSCDKQAPVEEKCSLPFKTQVLMKDADKGLEQFRSKARTGLGMLQTAVHH